MDSSSAPGLGSTEWEAPSLEDLLPELSRDEHLWRQKQNIQNARRKPKMRIDKSPSNSEFTRTEGERDAIVMHNVRPAICHYNARHKGDEFDVVKPLMMDRVRFRGQLWYHLNFWARSRRSNEIKRFFAEVHWKPSSDTNLDGIHIVEICTIIEGPLSKYRRSCAFCSADFEIFHPKGCRKFVCGNDKDRIEQRLEKCWWPLFLEWPFSCPPTRRRPSCHSVSHMPS